MGFRKKDSKDNKDNRDGKDSRADATRTPATVSPPVAAPTRTATVAMATPPAKAPAPAAASVRPSVNADARRRMTEEAAYFLAQKDGFRGDPRRYWLEAEQQIERQAGRTAR